MVNIRTQTARHPARASRGRRTVLSRPCARPGWPSSAAARAYGEDQAGLRGFAAEQARLRGLGESRVRDLMIAVGELGGNTLRHTSGAGMLALWATDDEIICQIQDGGWIEDPLAGKTCPDPAALGGGRGLWIVHQLCDRVEMRSGPAGTTFRLHLRRTG
ncbi:MAG TPA: ATP-binding protein [Streptosporangiaceae bacterium]